MSLADGVWPQNGSCNKEEQLSWGKGQAGTPSVSAAPGFPSSGLLQEGHTAPGLLIACGAEGKGHPRVSTVPHSLLCLEQSPPDDQPVRACMALCRHPG